MTTALEPVRSVTWWRPPSHHRRYTGGPVLEPLREAGPSAVPIAIAAPVEAAPKRDEAAERAHHLDRVCARFPKQISEANAWRLAQLLGGETDGQ